MAKRRRLILSPTATGEGSDNPTGPVPTEPRRPLGPGLGISAPPIARVAAEASAQAALAELSEAMGRARSEGRLVEALPLAVIDAGYLVRDRIDTDEEELGHLMDSIREHGQRTPVEVAEIAPGRYGLISGWRRIKALTRLYETENDPRFGTVLALSRRPDTASDAYIAMVEENEVRLGLSYYERARIVARAVELGVFPTEKKALQRLFSAASRARRSKIGSFLTIYHGLDGALRFPAAIPERLGLALAKFLDSDPARAAQLRADLERAPAGDGAGEQARLSRLISPKKGSDKAEKGVSGTRREIRPGVFLDRAGPLDLPVLTLSGPRVDREFCDRLERFLSGQDGVGQDGAARGGAM
ncbi:MAG: ParB/RepB/Spo0J family partition protein [Pseudorhodobacter sp.]